MRDGGNQRYGSALPERITQDAGRALDLRQTAKEELVSDTVDALPDESVPEDEVYEYHATRGTATVKKAGRGGRKKAAKGAKRAAKKGAKAAKKGTKKAAKKPGKAAKRVVQGKRVVTPTRATAKKATKKAAKGVKKAAKKTAKKATKKATKRR